MNGHRPLFEPCRLLSSCRAWRWGGLATTWRKTNFPTGVTDKPQKGEADNSRHGFLYLYHALTATANYRLAPRLKPCFLLRVTPSANRNSYRVAIPFIYIPRVEALRTSTLGYEIATPTELPGVRPVHHKPHPNLPQGRALKN